MTDAVDDSLLARTRALLEPGEIDLNGIVVETDLQSDEESTLHEVTLAVGETVATYTGYDPADTYVYSGNDDHEFGVNQHQGRTLEGDEFVWECQQLLRGQTYDVVVYYEATADQAAIVADATDVDRVEAVTGVEG